jgi:hypothetical protein
MDEIKLLGMKQFQPRKTASITRVVETAKALDIKIKTESTAEYLLEELSARIRRLSKEPGPEIWSECLSILRLADRLELELELADAQYRLFSLMKTWKDQPSEIPASIRDSEKLFGQLAKELSLAWTGFE